MQKLSEAYGSKAFTAGAAVGNHLWLTCLSSKSPYMDLGLQTAAYGHPKAVVVRIKHFCFLCKWKIISFTRPLGDLACLQMPSMHSHGPTMCMMIGHKTGVFL